MSGRSPPLYCCCCCFSHSAHWLPTRKKLLYTVANPARGLLNREKKKKKKSGSATLTSIAMQRHQTKIKNKTETMYCSTSSNILVIIYCSVGTFNISLHTNSGYGKERRILIGLLVTCQGSTRSELPWGLLAPCRRTLGSERHRYAVA